MKIETNRRSLLRGLFASPAIIAVDSLMPVKLMMAGPKLWGDGVHDDTHALQALIDSVHHGGHGRSFGALMQQDLSALHEVLQRINAQSMERVDAKRR